MYVCVSLPEEKSSVLSVRARANAHPTEHSNTNTLLALILTIPPKLAHSYTHFNGICCLTSSSASRRVRALCAKQTADCLVLRSVHTFSSLPLPLFLASSMCLHGGARIGVRVCVCAAGLCMYWCMLRAPCHTVHHQFLYFTDY